MTLTRRNPEVFVAPVSELRPRFSLFRQGIDRLFDSFFNGDTLADTSLGSYWMPTVDIFEQDDAYAVKAEFPGMKMEDVNITIHDNILALRGEERMSEARARRSIIVLSAASLRSFVRSRCPQRSRWTKSRPPIRMVC